jgi:hypothetical protein
MRAASTLIHLDFEDFRNLEYEEYEAYVEEVVLRAMKYRAHNIVYHSLWRQLREERIDLYETILDMKEAAEETN